VFKRVMLRRWAVLGISSTLAGILAGGVIAAEFGAFEDPESFTAAIRDDPLVRVADIGSVGSLPARGVFVQSTSTGQVCLWDAPSSGGLDRRGGCNSAADPLGGSKLSASLSYEGGPVAAQVSDARLIGLVAMQVDAVQVLMSDGTRRSVPMKRTPTVATASGFYRAFGYRFRASDLQRGVGPTAVLALDSRGQEIDRQVTGFAG
jgi:hypothetical protein